MKPKIGTVVLNYKTYKDTLECVESLKKQTYDNHEIIVLENGSGNESCEVLHKEFDNDPQVTLIVSDTNLGFAKGNNLGIRYAREKLNCDYVFVLNSDTIVSDGVFREVIKVDYKDIGAISPTVVDLNNNKLNPSENFNDITKRIKYNIMALYRAKILSLPIISNLYNYYFNNIKSNTENNNNMKYGKYVLQGCSYFLTPSFFKYYTQLYPNTFLYWEEINLLFYLYKVNLESMVVNTPPIIHKVAQSTKELVNNKNFDKRKLQFSFDSYRNSKQLFKMSYEEIKEKFN